MFILTDTSPLSIPNGYIPIIVSGSLIFILIFGFPILYITEKKKLLSQMGKDSITVKETKYSKLLSYHMLCGLFIKDKHLMKSERLIAYICILNSGLVIEGIFVKFSAFNTANEYQVLIGLIASSCTLFFNILINITKRKLTNVKYVLGVILFIFAVADFGIVVIFKIIFGTYNNDK